MFCNVFGGADSCQDVHVGLDSPYRALCGPTANARTDCIYLAAANANVANNYDPAAAIRADVQSQNTAVKYAITCPGCEEDMRATWCAGAVPKCGSFDGQVVGALLPALSGIANAQAEGQAPTDAAAQQVSR